MVDCEKNMHACVPAKITHLWFHKVDVVNTAEGSLCSINYRLTSFSYIHNLYCNRK